MPLGKKVALIAIRTFPDGKGFYLDITATPEFKKRFFKVLKGRNGSEPSEQFTGHYAGKSELGVSQTSYDSRSGSGASAKLDYEKVAEACKVLGLEISSETILACTGED